MEVSAEQIPETQTDTHVDTRVEEIRASLRKLERRDWWLWVTALVVMLLLTLAVVSMSFPGMMKFEDPIFQYSVSEAVRGLILLVLLFNSYTIYQQVSIKRLRRQFTEQLDAMGNLQRRAEEFHQMAIVDALTGLYNRRYADQRLAAEASRSQRYGHPLTVVALDLNRFKQVNDRYGHPAGDLVLREFADRLAAAIRMSDLAARMGGDEFLAILPECPAGQVDALLARLRGLEVTFHGQRIAVEFSAGWVSYQRGETTEAFLERADQTLYADKRASKRAAAPQEVAVR
jgi:diguanylate cyclase (GGDEF)-like protein